MQTNVNLDRTASKGAVRSGLILLVRTVVYNLPLLHMSGYANKCEPGSDCFKGSSPVWAHISCKNSCLLSTPAPHVRVCKQMNLDRTASKGAARSGLILLVRTVVYYLPLLHMSGKQMRALIGMLQREQSGLGSYCL